MHRAILHWVILFVVFPCPLFAKATRFEVKDAIFRNALHFVSDAPLETVLGTSYLVHGWLEFDPQNLNAGLKGEMEADMRGFEMGPESRQAKLRDLLFAASENPMAFYKVDKLIQSNASELTPSKPISARVSGLLSVRGVVRRHEMNVKASYLPQSSWTKRRLAGNLLKLNVSFDLSLTDVGFKIPEAFQGLLAPVFKVSAYLMASDQVPVSVVPPSS